MRQERREKILEEIKNMEIIAVNNIRQVMDILF